MNFNRYIAASILSHLILIGFLAVTYPGPYSIVAPIFNVDIVAPLEIPATPPPKATPHPRPPAPKLLPETIHEEGTESTPQTTDDLDLNGPENHSSLSEEERFLPYNKDGLPLAPRSFLFDKETIERFARKDPSKDKGLTFDTSEFKHRGYMRMLKEKIENIWKYPKEAARRGISGDLYIKFSIKKDGGLDEVELIRTSGYRDLDEAVIKALKDAEPFWPLPEDYEKDNLEIKGHFIYILGGTYIM